MFGYNACALAQVRRGCMMLHQTMLYAAAVSSLLPALKDAVMSVLDTDSITTQLRSK